MMQLVDALQSVHRLCFSPRGGKRKNAQPWKAAQIWVHSSWGLVLSFPLLYSHTHHFLLLKSTVVYVMILPVCDFYCLFLRGLVFGGAG